MHDHTDHEHLPKSALAYSEELLRKCLQCGYCLDNCPTYQLTGDEYDSARGRVFLIRDMLGSSDTPDAKTVNYIDRCLSCMACQSTCPSFLSYMHILDHAREHIENNYQRPLLDQIMRWGIAKVLPYPSRLGVLLKVAQWIKPLGPLLPKRVRNMMQLAPKKLVPTTLSDKPQTFPPIGECKQRVMLMTGCAQKALSPDINDATIRILRRHGCEVVIAHDAGCCGALTYHMGKTEESLSFAAKNIRSWMQEVSGAGLDAIVINTSGCGTVIKDYQHMFRESELAEDAATISALSKDISEILSDIDLEYKVEPNLRAAYHATCSLQFAQRIRFKPKKLLKTAGFTVIEPRGAHICCGAAGTYSLTQPETSNQLKENKVKSLEEGRPDVIVAGNIGCMIQISSGTDLPVVHTVELLDWVTGGPVPRAMEGKVATNNSDR
ncbi:MAG: glycolate oxidase subunit GlcF [Desulfobulbaceae bacterium]|nr:glycolate oxidase subunit GlcF [Desulfobulbaceae bacterium]